MGTIAIVVAVVCLLIYFVWLVGKFILEFDRVEKEIERVEDKGWLRSQKRRR
jgi:Na+-transporting methylmalonyl-CoA/oxaloacetate decarboxylase gamma subunit